MGLLRALQMSILSFKVIDDADGSVTHPNVSISIQPPRNFHIPQVIHASSRFCDRSSTSHISTPPPRTLPLPETIYANEEPDKLNVNQWPPVNSRGHVWRQQSTTIRFRTLSSASRDIFSCQKKIRRRYFIFHPSQNLWPRFLDHMVLLPREWARLVGAFSIFNDSRVKSTR